MTLARALSRALRGPASGYLGRPRRPATVDLRCSRGRRGGLNHAVALIAGEWGCALISEASALSRMRPTVAVEAMHADHRVVCIHQWLDQVPTGYLPLVPQRPSSDRSQFPALTDSACFRHRMLPCLPTWYTPHLSMQHVLLFQLTSRVGSWV